MSESTEGVTPYEDLKTEVEGFIKYSRLWAGVWAVVYYILRAALIIVSASVAEKADLGFSAHTVALLSLFVAVGTSLDTWLKTGSRYKGHFTFNDKFVALHTDLTLAKADDGATMDRIRVEFKKLLDDYAIAVLPT